MQLNLDFSPGLTQQFPQLEDVLAAAVYGCRSGLNGVAGELDMSPSELSRRLNRNGDDSRPLRVSDMVGIIAASDDKRPIYWLIEKFLRDPESTRNQAISQLAQLMPMIQALVEQSSDGKIKAVK